MEYPKYSQPLTMNNPILPALILLLLAWASIALLAATTITCWKLTAALWSYLNQPKNLAELSTAAIYAPIFETAL